MRLFPCALAIAVAVLCSTPSRSRAGMGEPDIRDVLPLDAAQRARLARLVRTDAGAAARLASLRAALPPEREPRPLAVIHYEGLVDTRPERIADARNLADMDDAAALFEVWQATGEPDLAARCRRYIRTWAAVYVPTGNDVNENKLLPLLAIHAAMREDFPSTDRQMIDAWITRIVTAQRDEQAKQPPDHLTNRFTKRLRLIAVSGLALDRPEWLDYALAGYRRFVTDSLRADGTSLDLEERDSLAYHASALCPLVDLAVLFSGRPGGATDLYRWKSRTGASLRRSVDFVIPYATGERSRREWTHTRVGLDHARAAAGLADYQPGKFFEPAQALGLLERAAYFEPSLLPCVARLAGCGEGERFPTWRTVLGAACGTDIGATRQEDGRTPKPPPPKAD